MTEFLKPKEAFANTDTITIQPVNHDSEEKFSLWDRTERKFIRHGETVTIDGTEKKVDKYIKLTDEQKKRWNRNLKYQREVIIDGTEYFYDMPPTVDKELKKQMSTIKNLGKDPLGYTYNITRNKTGENAWDVRYEVTVGEPASTTPMTPEPEIDLSLDEDEAVDFELTEQERKYVEAIKQKYPDYASKPNETWETLLKKRLQLSDERAMYIVGEYLNA